MNAIKVVEAYERAFRDAQEQVLHYTPGEYVGLAAKAREVVYHEIIENMMGGSTTLQ